MIRNIKMGLLLSALITPLFAEEFKECASKSFASVSGYWSESHVNSGERPLNILFHVRAVSKDRIKFLVRYSDLFSLGIFYIEKKDFAESQDKLVFKSTDGERYLKIKDGWFSLLHKNAFYKNDKTHSHDNIQYKMDSNAHFDEKTVSALVNALKKEIESCEPEKKQ